MTDYTKLVEALRCCDKYALCNDCPIFETCDGDVDKAMAIAADAIEALQAQLPKRGEWLNVTDSYSWYGKCSVCGEEFVVDAYYAGGMNYCPNCGAKMGGTE